MPWTALILEIDVAHADALADILFDLGAQSVSVEDADAGTAQEQPLFGEPGCPQADPWPRSRLRALCAVDTDIDALVAQAAAQLGSALPAHRTEAVADEDWVRRTQAQFEPIRISERLWIVPSWHEPPAPHALTLRLDPGLAFGTGSHATTRLCLRWLEARISGGERVLDYGCGSGILAIAARKLGAGPTLGVDIDPDAVAQARLNAAANAVQVDFRDTSTALDCQADLLAANILAMPLKVLAPLLAAHCRPGGRIVLAGLLDAQAAAIAEVYAQWFRMSTYASEEGWTALEGVRQ